MEDENDQMESNRKKRFANRSRTAVSSCTYISYLLNKKKSYGVFLEAG